MHTHCVYSAALPLPGECLDLDGLAPILDDLSQIPDQRASLENLAVDDLPLIMDPDCPDDGPDRFPLPDAGTIIIESRELASMLDVIDSVHAVLFKDMPFSVLERTYAAYTDFCEGLPPSHDLQKRREIRRLAVRLLKTMGRMDSLAAELDWSMEAWREWNDIGKLADKLEEATAALVEQ